MTGGVRSRFSTVGQDFQARRKPLQDVEIAFRIGGFFSAIRQFHHSNTGSSQISVTSWCHIQAATVKYCVASKPIEKSVAPGIRLGGLYF